MQKRTEYFNSKITELEESTENPDKQRFWQCLKSMDDTRKEKHDLSLISEETWLNHFHSLHSSKPLNPKQQTIVDELKELERSKEQLCSLDNYLINHRK